MTCSKVAVQHFDDKHTVSSSQNCNSLHMKVAAGVFHSQHKYMSLHA